MPSNIPDYVQNQVMSAAKNFAMQSAQIKQVKDKVENLAEEVKEWGQRQIKAGSRGSQGQGTTSDINYDEMYGTNIDYSQCEAYRELQNFGNFDVDGGGNVGSGKPSFSVGGGLKNLSLRMDSTKYRGDVSLSYSIDPTAIFNGDKLVKFNGISFGGSVLNTWSHNDSLRVDGYVGFNGSVNANASYTTQTKQGTLIAQVGYNSSTNDVSAQLSLTNDKSKFSLVGSNNKMQWVGFNCSVTIFE